MGMPEPQLGSEDELCLEIGRVARGHVQLDGAVRAVFATLAAPGPAVFLGNTNDSTARVVADCQTMLKHADVPDYVRTAGASALGVTVAANNARNRVVHDMWMADPDQPAELPKGAPTQWLRIARQKGGMPGYQGGPTAVDIEYVRAVVQDISDVALRLLALTWLLHFTLPRTRDRWVQDAAHLAQVEEFRRLVEGNT